MCNKKVKPLIQKDKMAAGSSRGNRGKKEGNPRFCFLLIAAFFLVLAAVLVLLVSNQLIGYTTRKY